MKSQLYRFFLAPLKVSFDSRAMAVGWVDKAKEESFS